MSPFRPARSLPLTPTALRAHLAQPKPLPLHLPKLIDHWPALRLWSLDDGLQVLRDGVGEEREVEIELGRKGRGYLDEGYQRVSMGFGKSANQSRSVMVPIALDCTHPFGSAGTSLYN